MPEPAQAAPQKTSGSFANVLASLTSKLQSDPWADRPLPDDVSTITYEQALRAGRSSQHATNRLLDKDVHQRSATASPLVSSPNNSQSEKQHRTASITIRVTPEEQAQLQARAVAAELSVSAYLRSCIFEAEALRTQVKEALAQMQSTSSQASSSAVAETPRPRRRRFFPLWPRSRTTES
jgi:hypothetical protein